MLARLKTVVKKSTTDTIKLVLVAALDVSGSAKTTESRKFLKDISSVVSEYNDYVLHVVQFDHSIHNHCIFTPINIDYIDEYALTGHGGSVPTVLFDYLQSRAIDYNMLVIFSDGYLPPIDNNKPFKDAVYVLSERDTNFEDPNCEILYW